MGAIKSDPFQFTYKKATIYVGCLSILQAFIIFTSEVHREHYVLKEKGYWLGIDTLLDVFLCIILLSGAVQEKHYLLVPWLVYIAFKCVFGSINMLLVLYQYVAESAFQFPTLHFVQILAATCAMFVGWIIVLKYFNERRDEEYSNLLHSPSPPTKSKIYVLPIQEKTQSNLV